VISNGIPHPSLWLLFSYHWTLLLMQSCDMLHDSDSLSVSILLFLLCNSSPHHLLLFLFCAAADELHIYFAVCHKFYWHTHTDSRIFKDSSEQIQGLSRTCGHPVVGQENKKKLSLSSGQQQQLNHICTPANINNTYGPNKLSTVTNYVSVTRYFKLVQITTQNVETDPKKLTVTSSVFIIL